MKTIQTMLFLSCLACFSACKNDKSNLGTSPTTPQVAPSSPAKEIVQQPTPQAAFSSPAKEIVQQTTPQVAPSSPAKEIVQQPTPQVVPSSQIAPHLQPKGIAPQAVLQYFKKYKSIHPKIQHFTLNPAIDTAVISENGALFLFPAHNFVDANGQSVTGEVSFQLMELRDCLDAANAGVGTMTTSGEMLETGGMLLLQATQGGKQLYMKEPIRIETTTNTLNPDFQLFESAWLADSTIGWANPRPMEKEMLQIPLYKLDFYGALRKVYVLDDNPCIKHVLAKLYNAHYQNTWIATREFEVRVKYLIQGCYEAELYLYMNNTNKPLWEVDTLVANALVKRNVAEAAIFTEFAKQRCTKLINSPLQTVVLSEWLNKRADKFKLASDFVGYPAVLSAGLGFINIDAYLKPQNNQTLKLNPVVGVLIHVYFDVKKTPTAEYNAILLLNGREISTFMVEESAGNFSAKYVWLPDNQSILVVLRDTQNKYVGAREFTIKNENKAEHKISLRVDISESATNKTAQQLIKNYQAMRKLPPRPTSQRTCCYDGRER